MARARRLGTRGAYRSRPGFGRGRWTRLEISDTDSVIMNCPICGDGLHFAAKEVDRRGRVRREITCEGVRCGFSDWVRLVGWG